MSTENIDVRYVAKLARLALDDDEVITYGAQLATLLAHVNDLAKLPTEGIPATAQVVPLRNVMRNDEIRPSLDRDDVLAMAPQAQSMFFRVPRIIGEVE